MNDRDYMRLTLDLAERARLTARPNPMVGALVVKDEEIVGSGYHVRPGGGHGEVNALKDVPDDVSAGATVYVNLEPCSFEGRTPACADLLVKKGISKVVCAMEDPDRRVSGNGFKRLRAAGIEVSVGTLADEAERLNAPYLTHRRLGRPYVTLKVAQSLDGSVATHSGDSKWITGPLSRRRGHSLRAEAQTIAVGAGTVDADDPELTVRHVQGDNPIKIVFDSKLRSSLEAKVFQGSRCILCTTDAADPGKIREAEAQGAEVWVTAPVDGRVDVDDILSRLASEDVIHLLLEGGRTLAGQFLRLGLVDRLAVFCAPRLIGGQSALPDLGFDSVQDGLDVVIREVDRLGNDWAYLADVVRKRDGEESCSPVS